MPKSFDWVYTDPVLGETPIRVYYVSGGYGGTLVVNLFFEQQQLTYLRPLKGLSFSFFEYHVATFVPGSSHALVFAWGGDNGGPPTADQALGNFSDIQKEFPHAFVRTSTFDDYAASVSAVPLPDMPRVYGEIGDTWLAG